MKNSIRELHASVSAIAKGGWDNMSSVDWGRLGTPLREQYKYLHKFANDISASRDTISLAKIKARARLYGLASSGTAALVEAGPIFEYLLPYMPRDGSTECLVGCKCRWVLNVISKTKQSQKVRAVWKLSVAEHCKTCISRNEHEEILVIPTNIEVPNNIGGY
jgi:hypothetical protein